MSRTLLLLLLAAPMAAFAQWQFSFSGQITSSSTNPLH
jgi:hypothetical protein